MSSPASSNSGVIVGTNEDDISVQEHNEYTRLVLNRLETLDQAKQALYRTHAVTVMAQVRTGGSFLEGDWWFRAALPCLSRSCNAVQRG